MSNNKDSKNHVNLKEVIEKTSIWGFPPIEEIKEEINKEIIELEKKDIRKNGFKQLGEGGYESVGKVNRDIKLLELGFAGPYELMDTRTLPELQEENDEIIKAYFQNGLGLAKTFNGIANYFSKIFKK